MIAGNHRTQTKNTVRSVKKDIVKREVGEQWTDDDGNTWEQRKGTKLNLVNFKFKKEVNTFSSVQKKFVLVLPQNEMT